MQAINETALNLGAPLVAQLAGGLAPPVPLVRLPAAAPAVYSTDESDDEADDPHAHLRHARRASAVPRVWSNPNVAAHASRGGGGAPVLRGALLASRALLSVAVAPVRVSAALVILPFALAVHGVAAVGGAARTVLLGSGRPPAVLDAAAEAERRTGAASNPAKAPLLDRYLGECLDSSVHEREVDTDLSPGERAAQELAWAQRRVYGAEEAEGSGSPLCDLRRPQAARPEKGTMLAFSTPQDSPAPSPAADLEPAQAATGAGAVVARRVALFLEAHEEGEPADGADADPLPHAPTAAPAAAAVLQAAAAAEQSAALAPAARDVVIGSVVDAAASPMAQRMVHASSPPRDAVAADEKVAAAVRMSVGAADAAAALGSARAAVQQRVLALERVALDDALELAAAVAASPSKSGVSAAVAAAVACIKAACGPAALDARAVHAAVSSASRAAAVIASSAETVPDAQVGVDDADEVAAASVAPRSPSFGDMLAAVQRMDAPGAHAHVSEHLGAVFSHAAVCFCSDSEGASAAASAVPRREALLLAAQTAACTRDDADE